MNLFEQIILNKYKENPAVKGVKVIFITSPEADYSKIERIAENKGLVVDEPDRRFEKLYKEHLWGSYNRYSHEDSEILIEVTPEFVEIWEDDEDRNAYQIFIDFKKEEVEIKLYD
jgi:hypothetical protein